MSFLNQSQIAYLRYVSHFVDFRSDELGDAVVTGDVADGDVDLGVREQFRNTFVNSADNDNIGSLVMETNYKLQIKTVCQCYKLNLL